LGSALALAKQGFTHIEVYEAASNLGFFGAGIQLAPNMARILDRLGCWKHVEREAVDLKETSIRRKGPRDSEINYFANRIEGETDKELGHVDLRYVRETYGYPHMVGHRASLAGALYEGCKREKSIKFIFSTTAEQVKSFSPKQTFVAKPRHGQSYTVEADVLLAADGVKSNTRTQMLRELNINAQVVDTGQAAYRIMLKREEMAHGPELLELINSDKATRWVGEKRRIIAYPVSSKSIYNISTVQPDMNFAAAPSTTYTTKGSKSAMLKIFDDFCPKIHRMLDLVPQNEVCEWKLRVHSPLPTWIHGSTALIGDAAVLSIVLSLMPDTSPQTINKTLRVYETIRKERAEKLVDLAAASGRDLHLGEGKAKAERDRQFAALKEKKGSVPDKWADADVQKMIYGHDCMRGFLRG
jgi:salicylate hydroxylase